MKKVCALFPGQGFQRFGMLAELASKHPKVVDTVLDEANAAVPSLELRRLLVGTGPSTDVTPTQIAQPLLLAAAYAHFRVWKSTNPPETVAFGMGHSLGEYTAFASAGLLSFGDAVRLVSQRGEAMARAGEATASQGMMLVVKPRKVTGSAWKKAIKTAAKITSVEVAGLNSPSQIVLSGLKPDLLDAATLIADQLEERRLVSRKLDVSGAFHSRFMTPAAAELKSIIDAASWRPLDDADFPVISNLSAKPYVSIDEIKKACVSALTNPVRWFDSAEWADREVDEFVSFGGGIERLMAKDVKAPSRAV